MRKTLVAAASLLLCCLGTSTAFAQGTSFGFIAGINRTKVAPFTDEEGASQRTGTHFGAFLQFDALGPIGFQLGARYTQKGWNAVSDVEDVTGGVFMPYVELPALLVVSVPMGPGRPISPHIFGGPAVAMRMGCEVRTSAPRSESKMPCDQAGITGIHSFDVGMMAGGGLTIRIRSTSVLLDVAYTSGFLKIDDDLENRVLSFSAGLVMPLGAPR